MKSKTIIFFLSISFALYFLIDVILIIVMLKQQQALNEVQRLDKQVCDIFRQK
jgi:hypothetical protein